MEDSSRLRKLPSASEVTFEEEKVHFPKPTRSLKNVLCTNKGNIKQEDVESFRRESCPDVTLLYVRKQKDPQLSVITVRNL
jgi:hypothetical protein